jgi:hypothetical protein
MNRVNPLSAITRDFLYPLQGRLLAPIYSVIEEWGQLKFFFKNQTEQECKECLQSFVRVILSVGLTVVYHSVWKLGDHHFGPLGGLGGAALLYQVAQQIDPRTNYISFSAWLCYKGVTGTLKNFGTNPVDSLCLLLLTHKKAEDFKTSNLFENVYVQKFIGWVAPWMRSKPSQVVEVQHQ